MVRYLARLLAITALAIVAVTGSAQSQSTDTKDVQIARKKLRVGLDTAKYVTSTTHTVNSGSTHRMMPTAKAVYDAIIALGGGGGGGGGHIILDDDTAMDQRAGLNFISTPTVSVTATDDPGNDETEVRLTVPNDGIGANQIANNAVGNSEMADNAIGSAEITDGTVALADMANMATSSLIYRKTAGTGAPEVNTLATLKTDLGLTGTNSGDQTITLTGDVTGSGTGSFAATIADNSVDGTDIDLGSQAQGDVMYYDGTNWVRLPPGTSGQFLQTQGASANPQWANGAGGSDNWGSQVVEHDATLTGTGVTGNLLGVADNAISNAKMADNAIGNAEMADNAIGSAEITDGTVALADMANMATSSLIYRKTAGSGAPEVNTLATLKTDLGLTGTNSGDQTITLTGDVTGSGTGSFAATIASNAVGSAEITDGTVALADMANMATSSLIYRKTAGTGAPEVNTLATLKTDLGLTGTNSGDQTITLTGDVTGSGTGSFAATIASNAVGSAEITDGTVALADMANMATSSLIYRKTAGTGAPEVNTLATLKTDLGLTGTNSGDQTITLTGDVTGSGTGSFAATIADNSVDGTDIDLGSQAQGDVMYYDGTNWVRLPPGTSGQFLQTQGASANPQWANGAGGSDNWGSQVVEHDATLTGTGVTGNLLGVADNAISNAKMADNAISNAEMADNAIGSAEITDGTVALADMANMATSSLIYRKTAGSGAPEVNTLATLKTDLGLTGTNSGDQTITLTGDVTGSGTGSFAATIASNAVGSAEITDGTVALADMANMATSSLIYRKTAGTGAPEVNTLATLKTDLGLTGTNSGDQTITLTGDVTGSGTGSFAATIASNAVGSAEITDGTVALADMANMATSSLIYRKTAGTGAPEVNTLATLKTDLGLTGTNSGDQTITLTGDVTGSGTGSFAATIAANAVTNSKVNDVSVAKLTSGTVASGLAMTSVSNSSINLNYNGGNPGFQLDDSGLASGMYSKDGTQYVYTDNVSTLIGSGTTNMQYIDGVLRLHDSDITNYVAIQPPATASLTANYTLTLPVDDGTAGQVLSTDGAGVLSWTTAGGGGFYQTARENGTARTQRGKFNFVNSTNTTATVVDDAGNDESEVKFEVGVGAITSTELATNSVNSTEITDGQVFSADIADGTIVNNDVSAGSLNPNRLAQTGATTNQVLKWNDTEWVPGSTVIISDFTSSGTFTVDGAKAIDVICVGAGGGGGSGRKGANGGIRSGGGGGAGGGVAVGHFDIADLGNPTSITVTVGTGGAGGASQATNSTNGNAGGAGGNTSCSVSGTVFIQAAGGGGGAGGTNAGAIGGATSAFGDFQSQVGAASPGTGAAGVSPVDSWNKCGGSGGSGGGITAANATSAGGTGGKGYYTIMNGGAGGGAGVSGSFGDFVSLDRLTGGGGGGGGSKTTAGAAAGSGAAGAEGAGGGGGGAGTDSAANSGAGGAGGAGFVRIIARY